MISPPTAGLQALPSEEIPAFGTFWSWQFPDQPPLPMLTDPELDVYNLGNGWYTVDDRRVDYQALQEQQAIDASLRAAEAQLGIVSPPPPPGGGGGLDPGAGPALPAYQHPAGALWLELLGVTNGVVNVSLHGTVPEMVYEVLSTESLTNGGWTVETLAVLGAPGQDWTMVQIPVGTRTNSLFLSARSWLDSDGSGLPDWWQLQWFGQLGVGPYGDDDGDGLVNLTEYATGQNPKHFDTPPAPVPLRADLNAGGTSVAVTWGAVPGPVSYYVIERSDFDWETFTYLDYQPIATPSGSATTYQDSGLFHVDDPQGSWWPSRDYQLVNSKYRVHAVYANGSSAGAEAMIASGDPALAVEARLVLNSSGRWQLVCPNIPPRVTALRLEWFDLYSTYGFQAFKSLEEIAVSNLVSGRYTFPDAQIINHVHFGAGEVTILGEELWVRGMDAAGRPGSPVKAGQVYQDNAPYFVDGREHLRQNLEFELRAATASQNVALWDSSYWIVQHTAYQLPSDVHYVESGFLHWAREWKNYGDPGGGAYFIRRDNLWPFYLNYQLHDLMYETNDTPAFRWTPNYSPVPAPAVLSAPGALWIAQDLANPSDLAVSLTDNAISLRGGASNLFGLPIQTALVGIGWNPTFLPPGSSVGFTNPPDYFYSQTAAPQLQNCGYYFAPVACPGANIMGFSPAATSQLFPLPVNAGFSVPTQPPLLLAAVGQPVLIGGWSKESLANGDPTKFGYLGQYFEWAFRFDTNGAPVRDEVDILSPYGDLFATEPGPVALVTMTNWGESVRGTGVVQVISLNVDANHDGLMNLSFYGPDQTTPHHPFQFWINNDYDRGHAVDCNVAGYDCDWEEDDLKQASIPDYPTLIIPDCAYATYAPFQQPTPRIPSMRDLEDYTRLWMPGLSNLTAVMPTNYTAKLTLNGGGAIRLFRAVEADGGTNYLFNSTTASNQAAQSALLYVGVLNSSATIILTNRSEHFIWCGVQRGTAEVHLQILDGGQNLLADSATYIEIKDIKEMYERWTVGDVGSQPPMTVATNAVEDLPQGVSSFQYNLPSDTNTPYILFVHGWNMERWEKDRFAEAAYKRLYWQGYQGRFGSFRWPTYDRWPIKETLNSYDKSEWQAWKSGAPLRQLLSRLKGEYPGQVRLIAHSMGNIVAGEALQTNSALVHTYVAMQAAVPSHAYDSNTPGRTIPTTVDDETFNYYAHYWQSNSLPYFSDATGAVSYVNFYNTNDYALDKWTLDQNLKPVDTLTYASWHYLGTNYFTKGLLQFTYLSFAADTYEIYSFCDEARCFALGAQPNVGGAFQTVDEVDLRLPPFSFGREHKYHSGQFRSTNMERAVFWNRLLIKMGLKEE